MKRSILLLIPLVMGLASCGNSSSIPNQELVNKVKELLNKQDLSESHSKTLEGLYTQEYDVLEIENETLDPNDEEYNKVSSYFNYGGYGLFGFYYDLTDDQYDSIVDEKGNIDTFDAISVGKGYWGISQLIRTMSFNRVGTWEADVYNLDINQSTTLKTTDEDLWVDNTLLVTDDGVFHYETRQELTASINKDLLFGSVSTRTFREIFSKVELFDSPGNVEHLDKLYYSICRELVSKNDKEISDFIIENQVSIQEEDDIKVSFVFTNEDIDEEEADYIFPGAIKGTLYFDKETYQFSNFNYEMIYKLEAYDEDTGSIKVVNTKFACQGTSYRGVPHDTWEPTNPTVYNDVAEFLEDVNEQVVPLNINL